MDSLERAHYYRDEAAHIRVLASKEADPKNREMLLSTAASYDKLYDKYLTLAMPPHR